MTRDRPAASPVATATRGPRRPGALLSAGLALLVVAASALIAAAPPTPDKGHDSPDAVWELFLVASAGNDWAQVYTCYEPSSGRRLLAGMALNADARVRSALANDGQKTDEWNAIVRRTGLVVRHEDLIAAVHDARAVDSRGNTTTRSDSSETAMIDSPDGDDLLAAVVAGVDEPAECFRAVMVFMARVSGRENAPLSAGQLQRLSVHDDTAHGIATEERAGQRLHHSLHFRRLGANWFIELQTADAPVD